MKPEIIWNDSPKRDFIRDLRSFAMSLDFYELSFNLEQSFEKYVSFENGQYRFSEKKTEKTFTCPFCGEHAFEALEGELKGKPALGLCCINCETYGAVFPNGM